MLKNAFELLKLLEDGCGDEVCITTRKSLDNLIFNLKTCDFNRSYSISKDRRNDDVVTCDFIISEIVRDFNNRCKASSYSGH